MSHLVLWLAGLAVTQTTDHANNPVYRGLVDAGIAVEGATARLPEPVLPDGLDADAARAKLRAVAGDDRAARELARNSVTAPFLLKPRDVKAGGSILRLADLYFIVHADLDEVDPGQVARQADGRSAEAGNMRFASKTLGNDDLRGRRVEPLAALAGRHEWYTHATGRLLDRIAVEATDRVVATRSADSLVVAGRTDRAFDRDATSPNRWSTLARQGTAEAPGPARDYEGSAGYCKITRLASEPGALFVEVHFGFVEPHDWFQGAPILRSKLGVIAQDQVRRLRREIETRRGPKKG